MTNITLASDEGLLATIRRYAAHRNTTVNALVREYLERLARNQVRQREVIAELKQMSEKSAADLGLGYMWKREDSYER
jgi:uncharacterized protein YjiS (DUF1127 family)